MIAAPEAALASLREPGTVMRLSRMGSAHQTRLSFMRTLLRRLRREGWRFDRPEWAIDAVGTGHAVYRAAGPTHTYCLVAFAHDLPPEMRSDRVIATAWDATFTLFDGEPTAADIARLKANVPLQEAGRVSDSELTLSRANRSVRLWDHVVTRLAAGQQPDVEQIEAVGYLMRTTAVYGSGKFGAADRAHISDRPALAPPFQAEMLTVWLIRAFTLDLVEHMARARGGAGAATLDPALRRRFGVGNSTGLGMAPFLINHPVLLHRWMTARETALARVRALPKARGVERAQFMEIVARARLNAARWTSAHPVQIEKLRSLRADFEALDVHLATAPLTGAQPWERLWRWAVDCLSVEGQEQLAALMLEPYGALVDDLTDTMHADEDSAFRIDGGVTVEAFRAQLRTHYVWAFGVDYTEPDQCARFWYVSEEKLEPRLGERHEEPGAALEQPLDTGRAIAALNTALEGWTGAALLADFLLAHPAHRHAVRRAQTAFSHPYAEIHDNLIDAQMRPIDILRCKLAFFGAGRFDPRSDRWVRICLFQNAPFPDELATMAEDDWAYPALPS